ncbi:MAG: gliding motility lipoprotein GldH [Bacteroidales bacterium]
MLVIIVYAMVMASCNSPGICDESYPVPEKGWHKDSIFTFPVEINDTLALYNFYLNIRNNTDYSYSNIYLFLNTKFPGGHATRDTIEIFLADPKGNWLGSGIGKIRDNQVLLRKNLRFPEKGKYIFGIEQAMRQDVLHGIEDVGLRIDASD